MLVFNYMILFQRKQCVLTGHTAELDHLHTFSRFPIYMGCTDQDRQYDAFTDMVWIVSPSSGSVQLLNLIDPEILYKNHHNPGSVGGIWRQHHATFHDFIQHGNHKNVLEVGGASGTLATLFLQNSSDGRWTIIEPSDQPVMDNPRLNFVRDFFEEHSFTEKFDAVVHSHVMEHVYHPIQFLKKVYDLLEVGGIHYISIPNMRHWLEQGYTNTLMFEHTYYLDYNVLEYLLVNNGFKIEDSIIQEHSIFVKAVKTETITKRDINLSYAESLFTAYVKNLTVDVERIKTEIQHKRFYLFGAHIFSQMLINLGLEEHQIECILDNDQKKHDKRLYGTACKVQSPGCLKDVDQPIVVLRGGVYTNEIKESILKINPTTVFV